MWSAWLSLSIVMAVVVDIEGELEERGEEGEVGAPVDEEVEEGADDVETEDDDEVEVEVEEEQEEVEEENVILRVDDIG